MQNSVIYPEMKETTTAAIEYKCSYAGGLYLTTDVELKGRGIKKLGNGENHARNKKTYRATENAFNKIKTQYDVCFIASL